VELVNILTLWHRISGISSVIIIIIIIITSTTTLVISSHLRVIILFQFWGSLGNKLSLSVTARDVRRHVMGTSSAGWTMKTFATTTSQSSAQTMMNVAWRLSLSLFLSLMATRSAPRGGAMVLNAGSSCWTDGNQSPALPLPRVSTLGT